VRERTSRGLSRRIGDKTVTRRLADSANPGSPCYFQSTGYESPCRRSVSMLPIHRATVTVDWRQDRDANAGRNRLRCAAAAAAAFGVDSEWIWNGAAPLAAPGRCSGAASNLQHSGSAGSESVLRPNNLMQRGGGAGRGAHTRNHSIIYMPRFLRSFSGHH
jgi:hypothetical protein